jgi:GT2 family glycosyltransferase
LGPFAAIIDVSARIDGSYSANVQGVFVSSLTTSQPQPSDAKSVLIVILNWNSPEETLDAVASVLKMDYPNFRVVIIDNGSTDNSVEMLQKIEDGRIELISSPENLGFTGGCNLGFERALQYGSDYVWLLNSDAVTEVSTLSSLVKTAEADSRIGLVSPLIASLQRPSIFMYASGFYDAEVRSCETTRHLDVATKWATEHADRILLLGTALLVKVDLIRKIGMLDNDLFAYWEDNDFSMRSNEAGFRNVVDFSSIVYHSEKFPTDNPDDIKPHYWYYIARNQIRFWKKHADFIPRMRPLWWAYQLQLKHINLFKGAERSRQAILSGMWDGWLNRTGPYRADRRMPSLVAHVVEMHRRRLLR